VKRPFICLVLAILVAGACSSGDDDSSSGGGNGDGGAAEAASPFTPAPPAGPEAIEVEAGSYNYSPAVIDEGDVVKAWWCSARPQAATDNIWYQEYNKATKTYSNRKSVLQVGRPGSSDWDSFGVCHPTVIRGSWPGRAGGQEAAYAMYYTSTNEATGGGSNNSTGVVFSADGITWHGQHDRYNPMIRQKVRNVQGTYGAGLPAAWSRGGSAVTLFWIDTTALKTDDPNSPDGYRSQAVFATSEDGIRFGPTTPVSQNGAPAYWKNDFAFDDSTQPGTVYSAQALNFRSGSGPDDKNETYNFGLYKVNMTDLLAGVGGWEQLAVIDTNLTGLPLNFEPGLVRTGEGKIAGNPAEDGLKVWFGGGGQTPSTWALHAITLDLDRTQRVLRQYKSGSDYWATTGFVPESFRSAEPETLGVLDLAPAEGKVPLYGCQRGPLTTTPQGALTGAGADRFLSLESCPGANPLGINGYLSPQAAAGGKSVPIYACKDGSAQFISNDAKCDGKAVEGLLGHARKG
jgi:hypothetical protein